MFFFALLGLMGSLQQLTLHCNALQHTPYSKQPLGSAVATRQGNGSADNVLLRQLSCSASCEPHTTQLLRASSSTLYCNRAVHDHEHEHGSDCHTVTHFSSKATKADTSLTHTFVTA